MNLSELNQKLKAAPVKDHLSNHSSKTIYEVLNNR